MADDDLIGDDFGPKVDLVARLREILAVYPEGASIISELLQNSDDAGATDMHICHDLRTHGTDSLAFPDLDVMQGPSLLVYNNGVFTETDFVSIQHIGGSEKKEQLAKTGRFGIGFNSVYHLSDVPSFVSGTKCVYFDPQCSYLPRANYAEPGKIIDFVDKKVMKKYPDQFGTFVGFGCDMVRPFNGTLFRLPLRTEDQADKSRICKRSYSQESIEELFGEFRKEAANMLLFLKNVNRIELSVWQQGADAPTSLFVVELEGVTKQLLAQRRYIETLSSMPNYLTDAREREVAVEFDVVETWFNDTASDTDTHTDSGADAAAGGQRERRRRWLVAQRLARGRPLEMATDPDLERMGFRFVPWVGVAALLSCSTVPGSDYVAVNGRAFCFLPLPTKTGLPVHVNGYFELSSNRRDIWSGSDMTGVGRIRAEWNAALLQDAVGPLYASTLERIARGVAPTAQLNSLWPTAGCLLPLAGDWKTLTEAFYHAVRGKDVLYKPEGYDGSDGETVTAPAAWVDIDGGVLPDRVHEESGVITAALRAAGAPVVDVTPDVADALADLHGMATVNPAFVRSVFKLTHVPRDAQSSATDTPAALAQPTAAISLLHYTASDLLERPQGALELIGLPFLPLETGGLALILHSSSPARVFLGTEVEHSLLAGAGSSLLARSAFRDDTLALLMWPDLEQYTNIRSVTPQVVTELLTDVLPTKWRGALSVDWTAGSEPEDTGDGGDSGDGGGGGRDGGGGGRDGGGGGGALLRVDRVNGPSVEWLHQFWRYVGQEPSVASLCADWPLIPTSTHSLYSLAPTRVLLPISLPEPVLEAAAAVALPLLDERFEDVAAVIESYLLPSTALGFLECAARLEDSASLPDAFGKLPQDLRASVLGYIAATRARAGDWSPAVVEVVKSLPLFPCHGDGELRPLTTESRRAPPEAAPAFLDERFVAEDGVDDGLLYANLGVETMSWGQWCLDHLFPTVEANTELEPELRNAALIALLDQLPRLTREHPNVLPALSNLAFVPTESGTLAAPGALYDPRLTEVASLLEADSCYPAAPFDSPTALAALEQLGLRTRLDEATITAIAETVLPTALEDRAKGVARAHSILRFLDSRIEAFVPQEPKKKTGFSRLLTLNSGPSPEYSAAVARAEGFFALLRSIPWLPAAEVLDSPHLPYTVPNGGVARPSETYDMGVCWLVSASAAVLGGEIRSPELRSRLQLDRPVPPAVLAAQLVALSEATAHGDLAGNVEWSQRLAVVIPSLFSALAAAGDLSEARAVLADQPWLWVGSDGFVPVSAVAFSAVASLPPFLYTVPADLRSFDDLLRALGVRSAFAPEDYIAALAGLAANRNSRCGDRGDGGVHESGGGEHESGDGEHESGDDDRKPEALSAHELDAAIALVQYLAENWRAPTEDTAPATANGGGGDASSSTSSLPHTVVYVPDESGFLVEASELVVHDMGWMDVPETEIELRMVHPRISAATAAGVGCRSLRALLWSRQALDLDVGVSAETFGQTQSLTQCLRRIVELYPAGVGMLYELLQNADDAGATEFSLVACSDSFGTASLLGDGLADWQGPALYVYNNSVFSDADFRNISSIGQASKLADVASTGRFGVGFNSVYNVTDVPSFWSGDHLVFFDPHSSYLPGKRPGLRINVSGTGLAAQFPDQLSAYRLFGNDLNSKFDGTIFRLPLRTAELAEDSDISVATFSHDDIVRLLQSFAATLPDSMLFLNNVSRIATYTLSGGTLTEVVAVEAAVAQLDSGFDHGEHVDRAKGSSGGGSGGGGAVAGLSSAKDDVSSIGAALTALALASTSDDGGGGRSEKAGARLERLYDRLDCLPDSRLRFTARKRVSTTTRSASGALSAVTDEWIVHQEIGGRRALALARQHAARFRFMPTAGAAVRVSNDGRSSAAGSGLAFCTLPLPVHTGLGVHINGSFELSSNRRDLWSGADMEGDGAIRAAWNETLLADTVASTYSHLIAVVCREEGPMSPTAVMSWPRVGGSSKNNADGAAMAPVWRALGLQAVVAATDLPVVLWHEELVAPNSGVVLAAADDPALESLHAVIEEPSVVGLRVAVAHPVAYTALRAVEADVLSPRRVRSELVSAGRKSGPELSMTAGVRLLGYCVTDLVAAGTERGSNSGGGGGGGGGRDASAGEDDAPCSWDELIGVPLLPTASGSFAVFERADDADARYFVAPGNVIELFAAAADRFVAREALGGSKSGDDSKDSGVGGGRGVHLATAAATALQSPGLHAAVNVAAFDPTSTECLSALFAALLPSLSGVPTPSTNSLVIGVDTAAERCGWSIDCDWLAELWAYLIRTNSSLEAVFALLDGWFALPTTAREIAAVRQPLPLLYRGAGEAREAVLRKFGVVCAAGGVLSGPSPPWAWDVSVDGILSALAAAAAATVPGVGDDGAGGSSGGPSDDSSLSRLVSSAQPDARAELRDLLLSRLHGGDVVTNRDLFLAVPLFSRAGGDADEAVSLSDCSLPPVDVAAELVTPDFVSLDSLAASVVSAALDLPQPSRAAFYVNSLFPRVQSNTVANLSTDNGETRTRVFIDILSSLAQLSADEPQLIPALSELPFVRADDGKWAQPRQLYDPRVEGVAKLLGGSGRLPGGAFSEPSVLDALLRCGLRQGLDGDAFVGTAELAAEFGRSGDAAAGRALAVSLLQSLEADVAAGAAILLSVAAGAAILLSPVGVSGVDETVGEGATAATPATPASTQPESTTRPATTNSLDVFVEPREKVKEKPKHKVKDKDKSREKSKEKRKDKDKDKGKGKSGGSSSSRVGSSSGRVSATRVATTTAARVGDDEVVCSGTRVGSASGRVPPTPTHATTRARDSELAAGASGSGTPAAVDATVGESLKSIAWLPVVAASPEPDVLPWYNRRGLPLACPNMARPPTQLELVSGTRFIFDEAAVGAPLSPALVSTFGWDEPLPVESLAMQLYQLGELHELDREAPPDRWHRPSALARTIYSALCERSDAELAVAAERILANSNFAPCIWTDSGFVPPSRVALTCPADPSPLYHIVPSEFEEYRRLLCQLGVRETFENNELCVLLASLGSGQLSKDGLERAVAFITALDATGLANDPRAPDVLLPDLTPRLVRATSLHYNDAPWLSTTELAARSDSLSIVHPLIPNSLASLLGARSLRDVLSANNEGTAAVECPAYDRLVVQAGTAGVPTRVLPSLLELGDGLGATAVFAMLDMRRHGSVSLLHPGLAAFQGPALTVLLEGLHLTATDAAALLNTTGVRPTLSTGRRLYGGSGLAALVGLGDALLVLSSGSLTVFDTAGGRLSSFDDDAVADAADAAGSPGASSRSGRGEKGGSQRYPPCGKEYADFPSLAERFPDQAAPLTVFGVDPSSTGHGTLLRIPFSESGWRAAVELGFAVGERTSRKPASGATRGRDGQGKGKGKGKGGEGGDDESDDGASSGSSGGVDRNDERSERGVGDESFATQPDTEADDNDGLPSYSEVAGGEGGDTPAAPAGSTRTSATATAAAAAVEGASRSAPRASGRGREANLLRPRSEDIDAASSAVFGSLLSVGSGVLVFAASVSRINLTVYDSLTQSRVLFDAAVQAVRGTPRGALSLNTEWSKFSVYSLFSAYKPPLSESTVTISCMSTSGAAEFDWMVRGAMAVEPSRGLIRNSATHYGDMVPLAEVAALVGVNGEAPVNGELETAGGGLCVGGFPLAASTADSLDTVVGGGSLPVLVNACLRVDGLERDDNEGQGRRGRTAIVEHGDERWNDTLASSSVCKAYSNLITDLHDSCGGNSALFYAYWPRVASGCALATTALIPPLFRDLANGPHFVDTAGVYRRLADALIVESDLGPGLAAFVGSGLKSAMFAIPSTVIEAILLAEEDEPVKKARVFSPEMLRKMLRSARPSTVADFGGDISTVVEVLMMAMRGVAPANVSSELNGMSLLPASDGSLQRIGYASLVVLQGELERSLLPAPGRVVHDFAARALLAEPDTLAALAPSVERLNARSLGANLGALLPSGWRGQVVVGWDGGDRGGRFPSAAIAEPERASAPSGGDAAGSESDNDGDLVKASTRAKDTAEENGVGDVPAQSAGSAVVGGRGGGSSRDGDAAGDDEPTSKSKSKDKSKDKSKSKSKSKDKDKDKRSRDKGKSAAEGDIGARDDGPRDLSPVWLHRLWAFLAKEGIGIEQLELHYLSEWPLIPLAGGRIASTSVISGVFATPDECPEQLESLLARAGALVFDRSYLLPISFAKVVSECDGDQVVHEALRSLRVREGAGDRSAYPTSLSGEDAVALRGMCSLAAGTLTDCVPQLQRLPMYEVASSGALISLSGATNYTCYTGDGNGLFDPRQVMSGTAASAMLLWQPELEPLYRLLGVQLIDDSEALTRMIVPALPRMPIEYRVAVMGALAANWADYRSNQDLVAGLRRVPFVRTQRGAELTAADLFDPRSEVLGAVYGPDAYGGGKPELFPPAEFSGDDWLVMLSDVGLRARVNRNVLTGCADEVVRVAEAARRAREPSLPASIVASASAVAACFAHPGNLTEFFNQGLCSSLSGKVFVPATGGSGEAVLTSYSAGAVEADRALVWCIRPVIAAAHVPPERYWNHLRLSRATAKEAANNLLAAAANEALLESWWLPSSIDDTFCELYAAIGPAWSEFSRSQRSSLQSAALIPVGSRLRQPSRVFARAASSLRPFIYELPRRFAAYPELMEALGVGAAADTDALLAVLGSLRHEFGNYPLNPHEARSLSAILRSLAQQGCPPSSLGHVWVPNTDSVLVSAAAAVYNDAPWLWDRIDPRALPYSPVHALVPARVCRLLSIPVLSELVVERPGGSVAAGAIDHDPELASYSGLLGSAEFAAAVAAVLARVSRFVDSRAQSVADVDDEGSGAVDTLAPSEVRALLARVELVAVPSIESELVLASDLTKVVSLPRSRGGEVTDSASPESLFAVDSDATGSSRGGTGVRLYVVGSEWLPRSVRLCDVLAAGLAAILDGADSVAGPLLAPLLLARGSGSSGSGAGDGGGSNEEATAGSLRSIVSALRLGSRAGEGEGTGRGRPGTKVSQADQPLLNRPTPLRRYIEGEVVAVKDPEGVLRYACVESVRRVDVVTPVDEVPGGTAGERREGISVLTVRTAPKPAPLLELLSSEVYSFKSFSSNSGSYAGDDPDDSAYVSQTRGRGKGESGADLVDSLLRDSDGTSGPAAPAGSTAGTAGPSESAGESGAVTAAGAFSREDVARSAVDMLRALNLPVSADHEVALAENLRLQQELAEAKSKVAAGGVDVRNELDAANNELRDLKDSLTCVICTEGAADTALIPCGHRFCELCAHQLAEQRDASCAMCRTRITDHLKIYLS